MFKNRTVITDVYLPGDVMGLDTLIQPKWQENIVALTFATVEVFSAEGKLLDLMANASLALYVFWLLAQRQRRIERHLAVNTRLEAEARVAVMLLDLYVRLRRKKLIATPTYHLPMTQTQIGDYLGLSAVHVNRILGLLRTEQVIDLEKNCVTILNLERLKALAHEAGLANSAPKSEVSAAELSCSAP
jgi:CRP-like cAMP-binding protein